VESHSPKRPSTLRLPWVHSHPLHIDLGACDRGVAPHRPRHVLQTRQKREQARPLAKLVKEGRMRNSPSSPARTRHTGISQPRHLSGLLSSRHCCDSWHCRLVIAETCKTTSAMRIRLLSWGILLLLDESTRRGQRSSAVVWRKEW
jgi:hypothetical protein